MHTTTTLDKLELSTQNVRQSNEDADPMLVASIKEHGLLNPLTVTNGDGRYKVVAGGRRLRALQELLKPTDEVAVNVISEAEAEEASLAENIVRTNMTDVQILVALRSISKEAESPNAIQVRFGIPMDRARKLARLSALAQPVFDALVDGDIDLEDARAFAGTDNHERQVAAFEKFQELAGWERQSHRIRGFIGMASDWETKQMLKDVGDQYEEAGGKLEQDLFSDNVRVCDPELLTTLHVAHKKAKEEAFAKRLGVPIIEDTTGYEQCWLNMDGEDADEERIEEIRETLFEDDDIAQENRQALEEERDSLIAKRKPRFLKGVEYAVRGDRVYRRMDTTQDSTSSTTGQSEADEGISISQKADRELHAMRRERLIERSASSEGMADTSMMMLMFTVAKRCFNSGWDMPLDGATDGLRHVENAPWSDLKFMTEEDPKAAFAAFKKWLSNDLKRNQFASELVARLTTNTAKPDNAHIAFITDASRPLPWKSSPEFWELFNKKQMVAMMEEIDDEISNIVGNMKMADMREYLHDLFTKREKIVWKGLEPETIALVNAWVPSWLQFEDEK